MITSSKRSATGPRRVAALLALCAALVFSASASARTIAPLDTHPIQLGPLPTGHFPDRVIRRSSPVASAAAEQTLTAPDGTRVTVALSPAYPPDATNIARAQNYVDYLASIPHGSELSLLHLYIGPPAEISQKCGGDASVLACYFPGSQQMFAPGEDPHSGSGKFPLLYVLTHEYGHHIANHRLNSPWDAEDYGPKYWSSAEYVCARTRSGVFFPGDEDRHYLDNPSEGWADSYAHTVYPNIDFQFNQLFSRDAETFAAISRDVTQPWAGPAIQTVTGTLGASAKLQRFSIPITLDGSVVIRLSGPRSADYGIQVTQNGRIVQQTKKPGGRQRIAGDFCKTTPTAPLTFRVVRRAGSGPFSAVVSYPG